MIIEEVLAAEGKKDFHAVHVQMNQHNPGFIRPLDKEVEEVFDPQKNKQFKHGSITRWVAYADDGTLLGRVAAFTSTKYQNKGTDYPVGGMGFFDCIPDQAVANALLDTAKNWLVERGMKAMDGPINFLDRDKWWGLMVEGFEREPMYGMSFNPPYYAQLLEAYGFKNYYNQYYYYMNVADPLPEKFGERYAKFNAKPGYAARHIQLDQLDQYAADFATIYNAAWAQHGEGKEITVEQVKKIFAKMKPIMDPRAVWFAYYKEDPIAMFINLPDLNQYFKHFKGQLGWWEKLQLLYMKWRGTNRRLTGVAFGVVPKYQALGVDSYLIYAASLLIQGKQLYDQYEMGWAGDWNPKMVNIYKSLGGKQSRQMTTYRCIFDPNIVFERHPQMEYK